MKARILIVDDEEGIRFTFNHFLTKEGHEVLTAADYNSALGIISSTELDIVFVDIILGGFSGIELLKEIKTRNPDCPVIIITGQPSIGTAADAVRYGAFDYLVKPIRKENLLDATTSALNYLNILHKNELRQQEREKYQTKLDAIFRSVNDAIITIDTDMRVIEANKKVETICGVPAGKIAGKPFEQCFSRCNQSCLKIVRQTLMNKRAIKEAHIDCRQIDHERRAVTLSSAPLLDDKDEHIGVVLVIRDIEDSSVLRDEAEGSDHQNIIIGNNQKIQDVLGLIDELADLDTTVLITGESGTGKELVANELHYRGKRANKHLVKVNCSALAENLLESELFGHAKGAFTGAINDKQGRFEMAHGGSILLDEIGDIPPRIQAKLLRVLQEKTIERVGDSMPLKVDVRVIAATNSDLRTKVSRAEFREDLFYRLNVVEIKLPALRDRKDDIPLLVDHFCRVFQQALNKRIQGITEEVLKTLIEYHWPGNVRELEHAFEHAFVLCHGQVIEVEHLPTSIRYGTNQAQDEDPNMDEAHFIRSILEKTDWNISKASRLLGMSRPTLYRKINAYNLMKQVL